MPILCCLLQCITGEVSGIQFIDSTPLDTCKDLRGSRHNIFRGIAAKSRKSTGWFYVLKLHTIFNDKSEFVSIRITPGNVDDRKPVLTMVKGLWGKLFGDKGYISKKLTTQLLDQDLLLITRLKKNTKNKLLLLQDKFLLYKRTIVETIFDKPKQFQRLWHHRFRSVENAYFNPISCLILYQLSHYKPTISTTIIF
ncbi:hypothetical protein MIDIC_170016 [Alphaproteobacteria bacterium]